MLLHPELISEILLRAGGIRLLRSISAKLNESNDKIIKEYSIITSPITQEEILQYISTGPHQIHIFFDNYRKAKVFYGVMRPINLFYKVILYDKNDITVEYMPNRGGRSVFTQFCYYDIMTSLNIIKGRTTNKELVIRATEDLINNYCEKLQNESLWIYLYVNCKTTGVDDFNELGTYNREILPHFRQKLIDRISSIMK